ncbi:MAG: hypothetical protein EOP06_19955, partial [Proteobacteria bacterium]
MRKAIVFLFALAGTAMSGQQTTMQVNGKILTTVSGNEITLRGINYPIIDDGSISLANPVQWQHKIDQAALTGANAIRLPWYLNGTHWKDNATPGTTQGLVNNGHLNNLLAYCHSKGMVPIVEIHNVTCSNDWSAFNGAVMNWWKSPQVLSIIEANKAYLIINLANEFGYVNWAGNATAALQVFQTNYNQAISSLRALNVNVPIMIDATECGQSSTELLSISESMVAADPAHNLIFSAHSYWLNYANSVAAIQTKLDEAAAKNVHFVLGEVANGQDNNGCADAPLMYETILSEACQRNIGWLAWTYDQDCSVREMTANGEFSTLTPWGNVVVHNTAFGLLNSPCAAEELSVVDRT